MGSLDSVVTALELPAPVAARRVFVEALAPGTIVNIAAFAAE